MSIIANRSKGLRSCGVVSTRAGDIRVPNWLLDSERVSASLADSRAARFGQCSQYSRNSRVILTPSFDSVAGKKISLKARVEVSGRG